MHFIFGGAYNGKTSYATRIVEGDYTLYTANIPQAVTTQTVIIRHIEQCIQITYNEQQEAQRLIEALLALAKQANVIIIGNDISRGIVPLSKEERFRRDCAGRLYQQLVQHAQQVTQIWYGIAQQLKE